VRYEAPTVVDFGSIADHTFTRCATAVGLPGSPPKDTMLCKHDNIGECSCTDTGLTP